MRQSRTLRANTSMGGVIVGGQAINERLVEAQEVPSGIDGLE